MGKYDLVEDVLKTLGVKFYFDAVAIRPGKPAVFAMHDEKPIFGLPGNPLSTMVTFQLFVVPAIDILSGAPARPLPFLKAQLAEPLKEKPGMTHFLPATIEWTGGSRKSARSRGKVPAILSPWRRRTVTWSFHPMWKRFPLAKMLTCCCAPSFVADLVGSNLRGKREGRPSGHHYKK